MSSDSILLYVPLDTKDSVGVAQRKVGAPGGERNSIPPIHFLMFVQQDNAEHANLAHLQPLEVCPVSHARYAKHK
jgi:hypothetical protein